MRAFVTGGTGFVGGALVRRLLAEGIDVTAQARPGANLRQLQGLPVNLVTADLSTVEPLAQAMRGCQWVFHVAGLYAFWGYTWEDFVSANVEGTRRVMAAAFQAGVERVVHTSSIAVLAPPRQGDTADEDTPTRFEDLAGFYKRSKFLAEGVVQMFVARGLPAVIVNPSAPIGAGDWKPTATGRVIVDTLNDRMPAYVQTRQNMVGVDDVAAGHLLAAQKGQPGRRYILGGENLTLKQFLDLLCDVSGRPPVTARIPFAVALAFAYFDSTLARLRTGYIPRATPEAVRVGQVHSYYDSGRARRELGYAPGPLRAAVQQAVDWYRANGYVFKGGKSKN